MENKGQQSPKTDQNASSSREFDLADNSYAPYLNSSGEYEGSGRKPFPHIGIYRGPAPFSARRFSRSTTSGVDTSFPYVQSDYSAPSYSDHGYDSCSDNNYDINQPGTSSSSYGWQIEKDYHTVAPQIVRTSPDQKRRSYKQKSRTVRQHKFVPFLPMKGFSIIKIPPPRVLTPLDIADGKGEEESEVQCNLSTVDELSCDEVQITPECIIDEPNESDSDPLMFPIEETVSSSELVKPRSPGEDLKVEIISDPSEPNTLYIVDDHNTILKAVNSGDFDPDSIIVDYTEDETQNTEDQEDQQDLTINEDTQDSFKEPRTSSGGYVCTYEYAQAGEFDWEVLENESEDPLSLEGANVGYWPKEEPHITVIPPPRETTFVPSKPEHCKTSVIPVDMTYLGPSTSFGLIRDMPPWMRPSRTAYIDDSD